MREGIEAPDIAVLLRGDAGTTALFAQVLAGYGIPVSHDRRVALPARGSAPACSPAPGPRCPAAPPPTC